MTALLEVRDLRVELHTPQGAVPAVDGVSFDVEEGQAFGLAGESGCGKTMTLRAILGLLPQRARVVRGQVRYRGQDLLGMRARDLDAIRGRRISMIFQEPMTALNPVMRVGDQIAEGPAAHLGYRRQQAHRYAVELLRRVGIPDPDRRARAYPHELSGGMRQRVMIAIAVSCNPDLILCDEPTTALDVTIQEQILGLLRELCTSSGAGLVYVTHDLAVVFQTCQWLAVMYAGQIVESGPVDLLFREPRHPYTLGLLRSVPEIERKREIVPIPGLPVSLVSPPPGCRFHTRCEMAGQECTTGTFPLLALPGGRHSACIHHDRCAPVAPSAGRA